jgi:hypothetical protein
MAEADVSTLYLLEMRTAVLLANFRKPLLPLKTKTPHQWKNWMAARLQRFSSYTSNLKQTKGAYQMKLFYEVILHQI